MNILVTLAHSFTNEHMAYKKVISLVNFDYIITVLAWNKTGRNLEKVIIRMINLVRSK